MSSAAWLAGFPQVTLVDRPLPGATGWNCKPQALAAMLDQGHDEVVWLDSDLAFARPFTYLFDGLPAETVVVSRGPAFRVAAGHARAHAGLELSGRQFTTRRRSIRACCA